MGLDLYYLSPSSPCRAVMMTAKMIGIEMNYKITNLFEKDHLKPEFIKMNPQHTIPTLDDNRFILWESHAIMQYLANAYAKTDTLYSKVAKKRALIDQRLLFNLGSLYQSLTDVYVPVGFMKAPVDPQKVAKFHENVGHLEHFLSASQYGAGDTLTIADIAIMATLSTAEAMPAGLGIKLKGYTLVVAYMNRCKNEIKGYQENLEGAKVLGGFIKQALENK